MGKTVKTGSLNLTKTNSKFHDYLVAVVNLVKDNGIHHTIDRDSIILDYNSGLDHVSSARNFMNELIKQNG